MAYYRQQKRWKNRGVTISVFFSWRVPFQYLSLFYLPCSCVIDTVPMEWLCSFSLDLVDSISRPRSIRVGGLGFGRLESLLNMIITVGMSGRSSAWSCTHNSAICMHLKTCRSEHDGLISGSIRSAALSSFHCRHAWKKGCQVRHQAANQKNGWLGSSLQIWL